MHKNEAFSKPVQSVLELAKKLFCICIFALHTVNITVGACCLTLVDNVKDMDYDGFAMSAEEFMDSPLAPAQ